jgi:hypothetical protein
MRNTQVDPSTVKTGDLLVAYYSFLDGVTATAPAGWTFAYSANAGSGSVEIAAWYRIATAADNEHTQYVWTFNSTTPFESGAMLDYRGVDPSTPIDADSTDSGSSPTPTLASLNTNHAGDMYVGLFGTGADDFALPADLSSSVAPTPWANKVTFGQASGDKLLGASGTVGADSGTMSSGGWATIALALKAANPPPP